MDRLAATTRDALAGAILVVILIVGLAAVAPARQPSGDIRVIAPPSLVPVDPSVPPIVDPTAVSPGTRGPLDGRLAPLVNLDIRGLSREEQARLLGLDPRSPVIRPGAILVEIWVSDTSPATLARLVAAGAHLESISDAPDVVTAAVPLTALTAVAAVQPEVLWVFEEIGPIIPPDCAPDVVVCPK